MRRRPLTAAVGLAVAALLLTACDGGSAVGPPGASTVDVDTPELQALKADAGVEDCAPGPGGGALPDVELACLGGGPSVSLASLRGPMVINFWASNCTPCIEEMPALQEFYDRHGEQVAVLGIDYVDTLPGAALELMRRTGATYPSLADPGDDIAAAGSDLVVAGLPQFLLLDAEGQVAWQGAGGVESAAEIEAMVTEHLDVRL